MLLLIRAPFCVLLVLVGMCSVFWLFWLSCQYLPIKWLAKKTSLRKPNHGEGIISTKPRPKSVYDFLGLMCCFIVLSPRPCVIYFILLRHDITYLCRKFRKHQLTNCSNLPWIKLVMFELGAQNVHCDISVSSWSKCTWVSPKSCQNLWCWQWQIVWGLLAWLSYM